MACCRKHAGGAHRRTGGAGETGVKIAVILFNLGGPDSPEAVEPFLRNLFSDPAIIGLPKFLRLPLARFIARRRAPTTRAIYQKLGGRSPIVPQTEAQARALEAALAMRARPRGARLHRDACLEAVQCRGGAGGKRLGTGACGVAAALSAVLDDDDRIFARRLGRGSSAGRPHCADVARLLLPLGRWLCRNHRGLGASGARAEKARCGLPAAPVGARPAQACDPKRAIPIAGRWKRPRRRLWRDWG